MTDKDLIIEKGRDCMREWLMPKKRANSSTWVAFGMKEFDRCFKEAKQQKATRIYYKCLRKRKLKLAQKIKDKYGLSKPDDLTIAMSLAFL